MLTLEDREWRDFAICDIFSEIRRGKRLKTADHIKGNIPYVSSSAMNNGVDAFIGNDGHVRKYENCITLANSGSVGTAFYHYYEFIASDHVTALQSKKLNKYSYLFITTIISRLQEKYSFNREINDIRINHEKIMLPVDNEGQPDFAFMEEYVREREEQMIERYVRYIENTQMPCGGGMEKQDIDEDLRRFEITGRNGLFHLEKQSKKLSGRDFKNDATIPVYTSQSTNNGIAGFTDKESDFTVYNKPVLVFGDHTRSMHIAEHSFCTADNVKILRTDVADRNSLLYIACSWEKRIPDLGYSRHWRKAKTVGIELPSNDSGEPDYEYMSEYVKERARQMIERYLEYIKEKRMSFHKNFDDLQP